MNKEETIVNVVALTVGAAVGFTAGYLIQKRKYENWFAEDQKRQEAARKEGAFSTPQGAVLQLHGDEIPEEILIQERPMTREEVNEALIDAGYAPLNGEDTYDVDQILSETGLQVVDAPAVDPETGAELGDVADDGFEIQVTGEEIMESIWRNSLPMDDENMVSQTENEDAEIMPAIDPERPYIITVDQFMTDTQYDDNKLSLVYYEGDGQLTDERETLVRDVDGLLGLANLSRFGLGSRDRNTVYIRNDVRQIDAEVIRDKRTYNEVVLGIKPEESPAAKVRRMRENDQ